MPGCSAFSGSDSFNPTSEPEKECKIQNIFDKCGVALYQNESLDLDHYYQEPYQDEGDEIKVIGEPFETDKSKKIRPYDLFAEDRTFSNFSLSTPS